MSAIWKLEQATAYQQRATHRRAAVRHYASAAHHLQQSQDHALLAAQHQRQAARHQLLGQQADTSQAVLRCAISVWEAEGGAMAACYALPPIHHIAYQSACPR